MKYFFTSKIFQLITLLLFAGVIYLYKLETIPPGLYVDEAVVGYNAYSILKTGNDEYGMTMPAAFRFFGSYTPPLQVYLLVPILAIFDLSIFSTRLISVALGMSAVIIFFIYLIKLNLYKSKLTPFVGTFIFIITPWTLFYSRVGYEIILGLAFFSLGTLFTYLALNRIFYIIPALTTLSLTAYTSHSQKYLIPLYILIFLFIFRKDLFKRENKKYVLIGLVLATLIQIPNLTYLLSPAFLVKSDLFYVQPIIKTASTLYSLIPQPISFLIAGLREFLSQYTTYFSPSSLFLTSDPDPQRSIPELSVFYPWMIIPYFLGLCILVKKRRETSARFLMVLLLLTPIPAALTGDPFSTQRSISILLPLMLVIVLGIDNIINLLKARYAFILFISLATISLLLIWRSYFVLLPLERAQTWNYGFQEIAQYINDNPDHNYIIDQYRIKPAYIELAFFLKYPPYAFQQQVDAKIKANYYSETKWDFRYKFGNISTKLVDLNTDLCAGNILIGDEATISLADVKFHNLKEVLRIRDPYDRTVFIGYLVQNSSSCNKTLFLY